MKLLARCQLEGVDEEGLKEREVEMEERKIRKKKRDDMLRCQNPNNSAHQRFLGSERVGIKVTAVATSSCLVFDSPARFKAFFS